LWAVNLRCCQQRIAPVLKVHVRPQVSLEHREGVNQLDILRQGTAKKRASVLKSRHCWEGRRQSEPRRDKFTSKIAGKLTVVTPVQITMGPSDPSDAWWRLDRHIRSSLQMGTISMEMATRMLALLLFKSFEITCSLTLRGFVVQDLGSGEVVWGLEVSAQSVTTELPRSQFQVERLQSQTKVACRIQLHWRVSDACASPSCRQGKRKRGPGMPTREALLARRREQSL
jgi:hypothetical protein